MKCSASKMMVNLLMRKRQERAGCNGSPELGAEYANNERTHQSKESLAKNDDGDMRTHGRELRERCL